MSFNSFKLFFKNNYDYIFSVFTVLLWQSYLILTSDGNLMETDNFTHALRLIDFIKSGSWAETMYMHDNYPFGQMLHFTRATDIVLFLTSLPFLAFMPVKQAVLYGCFLYQPVIAALSAVALIWAGRAFFGPFNRIALLTFYFSQYAVMTLFCAVRADHHVLLNLSLILISGFLMYCFKTSCLPFFKAAGLLTGISVWISPEGFLTGMLTIAGLVFLWLCRYQNMRQIRFFTQYFFFSALACLIVNPPMQGMFYPDNGRLSILLVGIAGCAFVSFYIEEFLGKNGFITSFKKRFFSLAFLSFISFGFILFFFEKSLFSSPIPAELYDIWAKYITELLPSYLSNSALIKFSGFLLTASLLVVLSFIPAPRKYKKLLAIIAFNVFFFAFMSLLSRRFGRTGAVYAALAFSSFIQIYYNKIPFLHKESVRHFLIFPIAFYFLCFFLFITAICSMTQAQKEVQGKVLHGILPYLSKEKGSILTSTSRGPETIWATGIPVVGTPYHSNAEGIIDTYRILYSSNLVEIQELLKKHHVKNILLDNPYHYIPKGINKSKVIFAPSSLVEKLIKYKIDICFIKPVNNLPDEFKELYFLWHVDFKSCDQE